MDDGVTVHPQQVWGQWEWLMNQIFVLPSRGTSTGLRNGPRRKSWCSTKGNAKPCSWGRTASCAKICWGLTRLKVDWQKNIFLRTSNWTHTSNAPLHQRRWTTSWAALGTVLPAGQERWSFSAQHWWKASDVLSLVLSSPVQEKQTHWCMSGSHKGGDGTAVQLCKNYCSLAFLWFCPSFSLCGFADSSMETHKNFK